MFSKSLEFNKKLDFKLSENMFNMLEMQMNKYISQFLENYSSLKVY